MEVSLVVSVWQLLGMIISVVSVFAVNTYLTRKNSKDLEQLKLNELKVLTDKCNEMMREDEARKTFVSRELFKAEIDHLNKTLEEILRYVRK